MKKDSRADGDNGKISRRKFMQFGGAALAGGAALGSDARPVAASPVMNMFPTRPRQGAQVQAYRTLGRTGWRVSDVGMGSVPLRESAVVRYAYDKGVNYFDTAEGYGRGAAESAIGEAM